VYVAARPRPEDALEEIWMVAFFFGEAEDVLRELWILFFFFTSVNVINRETCRGAVSWSWEARCGAVGVYCAGNSEL
jgi:hypothetical protein